VRYMGLDLGTKTVGVSLSDLTKTIASPYTTITFAEGDYEAALDGLSKIIEEEKVEKIILGLPKNMNNSLGFAAQRSQKFKELLTETFSMPVHLINYQLWLLMKD